VARHLDRGALPHLSVNHRWLPFGYLASLPEPRPDIPERLRALGEAMAALDAPDEAGRHPQTLDED
jgi:hypothetical protein